MQQTIRFVLRSGGALLLLCIIMLCGTLRADIVIDLKNGVVTETYPHVSLAPVSAGSGVYLSSDGYAKVTLVKKASGCSSTPYEARVDINLSPSGHTPVARLSVLVEYEGRPSGWTTHIGDDALNDGYGGGTQLKGVAEVQVLEQNLSIYSIGLAAGVVDRLAFSSMRLTEGSLHLNIADQSLTSGQPALTIDSKNLRQLFDFGQPDKTLFAAFNRVISNFSERKGCGARRVVLGFEQ